MRTEGEVTGRRGVQVLVAASNSNSIHQSNLQVPFQKVAVLKEQEESRKVVKARALEL